MVSDVVWLLPVADSIFNADQDSDEYDLVRGFASISNFYAKGTLTMTDAGPRLRNSLAQRAFELRLG